jgi:hypothetical protein
MFADKYVRSWRTCAQCKHVRCDDCLRKQRGLFRQATCDCGGTFSAEANDYWYIRVGEAEGMGADTAVFMGRLSVMSRAEAAMEMRRAGYPSSMLKRFGLE